MSKIAPKVQNVIMIAIALIVIAVIMPMALGLLGGAGDTQVTVNGTAQVLSDLVDPSIITLLTVLIPIVAIVGILIYFIPNK